MLGLLAATGGTKRNGRHGVLKVDFESKEGTEVINL